MNLIAIFNLFSSDMLTWFASNYHRHIQMLGQPYWYPWTIKVCGTWGLQFGKDSILGSSYISEFGMLSTVFILNTIFLLMYCFVVKPLDIILSIIIVSSSSHEGLTTIENLRKKIWREYFSNIWLSYVNLRKILNEIFIAHLFTYTFEFISWLNI